MQHVPKDDMVRTVLCFGDSNTFGAVPGFPGQRCPREERWPVALDTRLGDGWIVVSEGLPGRTTLNDDPVEGAYLNGLRALRSCLESHRPIDVLIIMLGTNDLKARFGKSASEIALSLGCLVDEAKKVLAQKSDPLPQTILVAPPPLLQELGPHTALFEGGHTKSLGLAREVAKIASQKGVEFLNAGDVCDCSPRDGFHIDGKARAALASALESTILGKRDG